LCHDSDRSVGSADQPSLLNPRLAPRLRHEDAAEHSTLALNKSVDAHTLGDHPGGWHTNRGSWRAILVSHLAISCRDPNRFEPAIATRGRRRTQRANSAQGAGRLRVTTLSCYTAGLIPSVVTLQLQHRVVTVGCCTAVLCCVVALLCCAALLCCTAVLHCCVSVSARLRVTTLSCYTAGLIPSVVTLQLQHRVVTPWLDLTVNTVRLHFEGPA